MIKHISRRGFMKKSALGVAGVAMFGLMSPGGRAVSGEPEKKEGGGKTLIAYFSHSGNTRFMAGRIHERIGGDIIEIKTVRTYSKDRKTVFDQAKREQAQKGRPELATDIPNLSGYDTIFVGYPCWWGTMPMAWFTFFEKYDCQGKILVPFTTYNGSVFGRSLSDIKKLNPRSTIREGLAIKGGDVRDRASGKSIDEWLESLNGLMS